MKYRLLLISALLLASVGGAAQDNTTDDYVWPEDPAVVQKLQDWQDLKFGVILHWGLYSVPGIVESWNLCNESWVVRPEGTTYEGYKQWYWGQAEHFNPTAFNPGQWASVFGDAGMKYLIFTTKHHDGYCLYDSEYTDFSTAKGPAGRDFVKPVFDTFRSRGFMIGEYFSKPDWHYPGYWNPYYATPDRNFNYERERHPDWWESYVNYTRNQIGEITDGRYGNIDILWLDGGWVSGEEIGLDSLVPEIRNNNPGIIIVDRMIGGVNENYQTPERTFPSKQILHPWESCIPLSDDWGWTPDHRYKSARHVIAMLVQIVAKGGNLVVGIGPTPQGLIDDDAVAILAEVGAWMKLNGEAIYATRPTPVFNDGGSVWFTASRDGGTTYAIYAPWDDGPAPESLSWSGNVPSGKVTMLASGKRLKYTVSGDRVTVRLPRGMENEAFALKFSSAR